MSVINLPLESDSLNEKAEPESVKQVGAVPELDTLEHIFAKISKAPVSDRETLLDELCTTHAVRDQMRQLLGADSTPDPLLDNSLFRGSINFRSGDQVGPYKLLQELGQGGMGVVYMAEQIQPVRRKVALKILKAGLDTREVIARFDAERQALSMMDHPNIAKVFEAGATDSGRPYLAMELVRGQPITEFCNQQKLSIQQRLKLFLTVCLAIQHAHQKGIIHRDIKPSNVLVVEYDGQPVAKVIDFGVAKALSQPLTEKTMFTGLGEIIGTFEYMSPEQACVNQLDIDTRSDIYSLGVLLYELFTNSTPFDKERLRSVAWDEMLRIIRQEDAPRPSKRLADIAQQPSLSKHRSAEPAKWSRLVKGELDWITMKALEKDRNRRYDTPNELANDIRSYLSGDSIMACPPTVGYRFRKFARRNRVAIATIAVVAASLVLGLIGTSWQAFRATRAEAAAVAERDLKEDARREAMASAKVAQAAALAERQARKAETQQRKKAEAAIKIAAGEAAIAKAVNDFLQKDLLGLASVESQLSAGMNLNPDLKLVTLLERASQQVESRFADQPRIKARIQATLSKSFGGIGRYDEAIRLLKEVLEYWESAKGIEDSQTLRGMNNLAAFYIFQSRLADAEPLLERTLEVRRRVFGANHPDTLSTMNNLAVVYKQQARYEEAERLYEECLKIERQVFGEEHPKTANTMSNLALVYDAQGRYEEAERLFTQSLQIRRQSLAPGHPEIAVSLSNLALLYEDRYRYDEAIELLQEALEIQLRGRLPEHPDVITIRRNLAGQLRSQGKYEEAETILTNAIDIQQRAFGSENANTLRTMNSLALLYLDQDQFAKAESLFTEVLETRRRLNPDHPATIQSISNLAVLYGKQERIEESILLHEEALKLSQELLGNDHRDTLSSKANVAMSHLETARKDEAGRKDKAVKMLEAAYQSAKKYHELNWIGGKLATVYADANEMDKAIAVHSEQIGKVRERFSEGSRELSNALAVIALRLLKMDAWEQAEPVLRECLSIRENLLPGSWYTANARSMLGECLLGQKRIAEAEPLLVQGYQGLKDTSNSIPFRFRFRKLSSALQRLIDFSAAANRDDENAEWKAELSRLTAGKR